MANDDRVPEELWTLAAAACEESFSEADQARLEALLADDTAARLFSEYCNLHCDLHFRANANRAADEVLAQIEAEAGQETEVGSQGAADAEPSSDTHLSPPHSSSRHWLRTHITRKSIATAVTVLAAAIAVMAVLPVSDVAPKKKEKKVAEKSEQVESVARLVHSADAVWSGGTEKTIASGGSRKVAVGMRLYPGDTLRLTSGMAEFKFFNGAEVVLEGPAEFEVQGRKQCGLARGRLVARAIEQRSKGFIVDLPAGRVEDLGTEFGVEVLPAGKARVAVFDGHVAVMSEGQSVEEGVQLAKDEEAELLPSGEVVRNQSGFAKRFVRTVPTFGQTELGAYGQAILADKPVAYWPLSENYGRIVRDAAESHHGWYRGSARRINDGRLRFARFDGLRGELEIPYGTNLNKREFSVELWLRPNAEHREWGTLVTTRHEPDGGLFGFVLYVDGKRLELWTGKGPQDEWDVLSGPKLAANRWTHVVATYERATEDARSGVGRLFVDGRLVATADQLTYVPNPAAPLRIGASQPTATDMRYSLRGDLARIAVYDRPLKSETIRRHFKILHHFDSDRNHEELVNEE